MSTVHQPACASLDQCLTLPYESLEHLKSVKPVDIDTVIAQLKIAAESARALHALVEAELPESSWQTRDELEALLDDIPRIVSARSGLLSLAMELEQGSIVHRRALRVSELHTLRRKAIDELRSLAESRHAPPPSLPGPEAEHWIEWACGLKEPEDAQQLQQLRKGFAALDDFVASVEPGMWVAQTAADKPRPFASEPGNPVQEVGERVRSRLSALAMELERGSIVHHRTLRVRQMCQFREQAVKELQAHAVSQSPPHLPGPEAEHWIKWACSLKEPQDMEALQALRDGFARLDDFVANLEFGMWVAGPSSPASEQPSTKDLAQCLLLEAHPSDPVPIESKATMLSHQGVHSDESLAFRGPEQPLQELQHTDARKRPEPSSGGRLLSHLTRLLSRRQEGSSIFGIDCEANAAPAGPFPVSQRLSQTWQKASLIPLAIATVMVLVPLGALQWKSNRTFGGSFRAIESTLSRLARGNSGNKNWGPSAIHREAGTEFQDQAGVPTTAQATSPAPDAGKEGNRSIDALPPKGTDNVGVVDPERHPPRVAAPVRETSSSDLLIPASGSAPGASSDTAVAPVPPADQKALVPSGGAQGLVIHGSAPLYPAAARQARIEGTVLLRAVIGKDGNASDVRVLSGHSQLIQAALVAVKQWRFTPYAMNGEPVDAATQIDVRFTLQDN